MPSNESDLTRRQPIQVAVIVDDLEPDRRRYCFWEGYFEGQDDVELTLVSLIASMNERVHFNVLRFDVVIFNWCVLDGAVMYASDRTQAIVRFYDDHFRQFVRQGGVLIVENQPRRWHPTQDAYDVLFKDEIWVATSDVQVFGSAVRINERFKKHPLLHHLDNELHSAYKFTHDMSWFPAGSTSSKSLETMHPTKMYSGSFDRWTPEWLPVIYGDKTDHSPVMLLKTEGEGLWVVTTMYLGSSGVHELVDSFVVRAEKRLTSVRQFHESERRHRRYETARLIAVAVAVAALFFAALRFDLITAEIPFQDSIGGNFAFSLLLAAGGAAVALVRDRISRSLRSIFNR